VDDPRDPRNAAPPGNGQILHFRKVGAVRGPPEGDATGSAGEPTAADLFALLWQALADILGTAAAATLLRRAAQRVTPSFPELAELSITRESLEYQYKVPKAWHEAASEPPQALRDLVRELWTFLIDLTGSVVVGRLTQISELRERGLVPPSGPQP
jgi:hypothetical protein